MKEFFESFSNREISIIFWTTTIVIVMFFINISASTNLTKAFFAKKLVFIYVSMLLYLGTIIYFLYFIQLWEISLFKDFIIWLLTSAFVMLLNFNNLKSINDFKNILLKILTINIVVEFIASNYNFSLLKELILIPVVTFISLLAIVAQQKKSENKQVLILLNGILSYVGIIIFGYVAYKIVVSPEQLFTIKNLKSFLFAPLFTILFIPFVFLIVVYSKYELIFLNINRYNFLDKSRKRQIKFAMMRYGNINLKYLNNAHNITIWRKSELLNEKQVHFYIREEIKNSVTFNGVNYKESADL